jgi:hypothetical protein
LLWMLPYSTLKLWTLDIITYCEESSVSLQMLLLSRPEGQCVNILAQHDFPPQDSANRRAEFKKKTFTVAGDRIRVTRVTGGNTHHYSTTTLLAVGTTFV